MTPEQSEKVWQILVEDAGAQDIHGAKDAFVYAMSRGDVDEYRFMGKLGFGGKFWPKGMRVTCYPEDRNAEREAVIERTNARLGALK